MMSARQLSRCALPRTAARSTARYAARGRQLRAQSTSTSSSGGGGGSHFVTGAAGGVVGALLAYGVYSFTPAGQAASKLNKAAVEANKKYKEAATKLQQNTPDPGQVVDAMKQFVYSYVAWIPGSRGYVDAAFRDLETVRENHKEDADKIIGDAYKQFQELSKSGLSMESAAKAYDILAELSSRVAQLSTEAISEILDNHPQVKEKFGGSIEKLQDIGNSYGPDAKKQVDETWRQVRDIFAGGFSAANVDKARQLVNDRVQQFKKAGDEAWKKGLEEARPYLDKNPRVKALVEKNADALRQGNVGELFQKVRSAVDSGSVDDLSKYVSGVADKAKEKGSDLADDWGLEKYLKLVPDSGEIVSKLQQIRKIAEDNTEDGEKLLKETVEELKKVLGDKATKAQEMVDRAKKQS